MTGGTRVRATVLFLAAAALGLTAVRPLAAQETGSIRGKVTDAVTARPISGAQVFIVGTERGGLTNAQGDFFLLNVPAGEHTLRVEIIGYGPRQQVVTVTAGSAAQVDIALSQVVIALDEVVVTGTPGATQKRALGNSISSITVEQQLQQAPIRTVDQLLQGRTPGLTLMPGAGTAGTAGNIRIRGAGSLNASNRPIFYVDGVRIQSTLGGDYDVLGQTRNPLDHINPADIESIEIIKGPAASTLYGADAAAGVIQIITKKGRQGQQSLDWTGKVEIGESRWALDKPNNYKVCTESMIGDPNWPGCAGMDPSKPEIERMIVDNPLERNGACAPWEDPSAGPCGTPPAIRTGEVMNYNLAVRGGGERYSFYASGDRSEETGIFFNNYSNRTTGRLNFQVTPLENLSASVSIGYTRADVRLPLNDNASNGLLRNAFRGEPGRVAPWAAGWLNLGPEQINQHDNRAFDERFIIGTTVNFKLFDRVSNRLTVGLDRDARLASDFTVRDTTGRAPWGQTCKDGCIDRASVSNHVWTVDYAATLDHDLTPEISSALSAGF